MIVDMRLFCNCYKTKGESEDARVTEKRAIQEGITDSALLFFLRELTLLNKPGVNHYLKVAIVLQLRLKKPSHQNLLKTQTTENQIHQYGWSTETVQYDRLIDDRGPMFRAYQGGFKTLWRSTPEQVLSDVERIVNARKDPANQRVPF